MLFFEIDKTIILLNSQSKNFDLNNFNIGIEIKNMPHYKYINRDIAQHFGMEAFYIYLRPFAFGFLNAISNFYELVVYSKLNKKLLVFILDILQEEKEFFSVSISSKLRTKAPIIHKFFTEGRSEKNVALIDWNAKSWAQNPNTCIPVHKFEGERMDANLLYLQKYLIEIASEPDLSKRIKQDFNFSEQV